MDKHRWRYSILMILFLLQVILGFSIILLCEYVKYILDNHVYQIDKQEVLNIFFMIKLYGLHLCFFYLCGVPIISQFNDAYTKHLGLLVKIWFLLSLETVIGAIFMTMFSHDASNYLKHQFGISLKYGLQMYLLEEPIWVYIWDDIQYKFQCCGLNSLSDWNQTLNVDEATDDEDSGRSTQIPPSCLRSKNYKLDSGEFDVVYYEEGCLSIIERNIDVIDGIMIGLNVAVIITMIFLFIFMQMVFLTSRCLALHKPDMLNTSKESDGKHSEDSESSFEGTTQEK